ncbi:hypothetical protein Ocin01_10671 [Orchesella cincta]|uniref:Transmembrane protein n=1 Tax=Orchesella cincta TaxID=48709 RepID=A0A1D2MSD7_ORCCI|nr:hypothetical protein Ocin01_10671 [Orchesella cincta]
MSTNNFKFPVFSLVGGILLLFLATSTLAQRYRPSIEQCEKYCFADCSEYYTDISRSWAWGIIRTVHAQNEYTDCVTANANCNCESRFSFSNPLFLLGLITFCIILILILYHVYRRCKNSKQANNGPTIRIYTHPIVASPNTISNGSLGTANAQTYNTFQMPAGVADTPPEYLPPPSYYECASNPTKSELG